MRQAIAENLRGSRLSTSRAGSK